MAAAGAAPLGWKLPGSCPHSMAERTAWAMMPGGSSPPQGGEEEEVMASLLMWEHPPGPLGWLLRRRQTLLVDADRRQPLPWWGEEEGAMASELTWAVHRGAAAGRRPRLLAVMVSELIWAAAAAGHWARRGRFAPGEEEAGPLARGGRAGRCRQG